MRQRITRKWRPPLALVLGGVLMTVLCLPMAGFLLLRLGVLDLGAGRAGLVVGIGVVVATLVLGYLLWRLLYRPLVMLADRAEAIAEGAPDALDPLPRYGTAELQELGQSVLDMGSTLHSRAASVQAYTQHVTHELKSPLTSISGAAELLEGDTDPEDRAHLVRTIRTASARMESLLNDLRRLAQAQQALGRGQVALNEVVAQLRPVHPGLEIVVEEDGPVPLSRDSAVAVLTQLCQNARAHGATRLTMTCGADGLFVEDDGPGIAPGDRDRVFDPFFTTRREEGGTGLGLSIVRAMLEASGASIVLIGDTSSRKGACFRLSF